MGSHAQCLQVDRLLHRVRDHQGRQALAGDECEHRGDQLEIVGVEAERQGDGDQLSEQRIGKSNGGLVSHFEGMVRFGLATVKR